MLPVVRVVESQMAADATLNHEYLPVAGLPDFRSAAARILLGSDSAAIAENRVSTKEFVIKMLQYKCTKLICYVQLYNPKTTFMSSLSLVLFVNCSQTD